MAGSFNQPPANPSAPGGTPSSQEQLPEHRLKELETKLRNMELQNVQLRTTLNHVNTQQPGASKEAPAAATFDPAVQTAIDSLVDAKLQPMATQYQQALGSLHDQIDDAKFSQRYGGEKFKPYMDRVEQVRQEHLAQNRFIGREDALRLVYFEEEGKKAQPVKTEPTNQPQWDQNLGNFVHPGTTEPWFPGQPVKTPAPAPQVQAPAQVPGQTQTDPQAQPQVPAQAQVPAHTPVPPQVPQAPAQPEPFFQPELDQQKQPAAQNQLPPQQIPVQNNLQVPQLPDAAPNPVGNFQDPSAMTLDLNSSQEELDAWENRYGDQPL